MNIDYIDTNNSFREYLNILEADCVKEIALDIEGEYNLHQYGEKLCLIQVSDGRRTVVIDPFTISDELISSFFNLTGVDKIMYDSSSDQKLILKQYGVRISFITDLRPAAELLDLPKQDLSSVMEVYMGVEKTRNYQRYDWTKRPVDSGALEYAMNDVIYLFELRKKIFKELEQANLMDEYLIKNKTVNTRKINLERKPGFFRKPAYFKLKSNEQDRVQRIFYIREKYAQEYNVPPHFIFPNHVLIPLGKGQKLFKHVRLYGGMKTCDCENLRSEIAEAVKQD
jgi:ribonuclease D